MNLVHNERIKLTAAWLNTIGAATVVTGVIAPIVALVFGVSTPSRISSVAYLLAIAGWLTFGICLHMMARSVLGRLRA
jgi:hypothetical protein